MKRYILLKAPDGEIVIIDNSTHLGKRKVESRINEGCKHVGFIESDLSPTSLSFSLSLKVIKKLDKYDEIFSEIMRQTEKRKDL